MLSKLIDNQKSEAIRTEVNTNKSEKKAQTMCDDDGEICQSVTQQAVQTSPAKTKLAVADTQTEFCAHIKELKPSTKVPQPAQSSAPDLQRICQWKLDEVQQYIYTIDQYSGCLLDCLRKEKIDGHALLALTENDVLNMRYKLGYSLPIGELKKFWSLVFNLQLNWRDDNQEQPKSLLNGGPVFAAPSSAPLVLGITGNLVQASSRGNVVLPVTMTVDPCPCPQGQEGLVTTVDTSREKTKRLVAPEYFKTAISLGYSFVVTWITSFVMVIVHERVPDMKRYPPLPDIFLDNVPHIPWAFNMCEITGSLLFSVWLVVLIFHKYRMVLLRRFFALAGTVFLLRCVTMLITSLSVPGTHLQCNQKDFAIDDPNVDVFGALVIRMTRAYRIWSGLGMSIQGVRTCGDYMFSGHTVALTLLNFFITEYTPRNLYFLHTLTWLLNMFGIFFILAAHEHYSIDVFVAFYITSRLFLYYHTLANNRALMQSDSNRTRIWFPMFSYFENSVDGIIPNEFDTVASLMDSFISQIVRMKKRIWNYIRHIWSSKTSESRKSSMHMFEESDSELRSHVYAATAKYVSVSPAVMSNVPVSTTTIGPAQLKHTKVDSSSNQYVKTDGTDIPLTEKKIL